MNNYLAVLMNKPSLLGSRCRVCGLSANNGHHIVPRSQGGAKGPRITLCGSGTTGCHGEAEDKKLHFRWVSSHNHSSDLTQQIGAGHWEYLKTATPTKYERALQMGGWKRV